MELRPNLHLLDVGRGIGGPARYFASEHSCRITGVDLSEDFVNVARSLTRIVKLDHLVQFRQASVLRLPFEAQSFDRAYMIHVGMNVSDKTAAYSEVRRAQERRALCGVRQTFAIDFTERVMAQMAQTGPPPPSASICC